MAKDKTEQADEVTVTVEEIEEAATEEVEDAPAETNEAESEEPKPKKKSVAEVLFPKTSAAIKKRRAKKEADSEEEAKPPSKFTQAEGWLKKTFGAEKGDMIADRTPREKLVELHQRAKDAGKA